MRGVTRTLPSIVRVSGLFFALFAVACEPDAAPPAPAASASAPAASAKPKPSAQAAPSAASVEPLLPPIPAASIPTAEGSEPLHVKDSAAVEATELLSQARAIAKKAAPKGVLVGMSATPLERGFVNLNKLGGYVQFTFEWKDDKAKGTAKEGSLVVSASASGVAAGPASPAALSLSLADQMGYEGALTDPKCRVADAWKKVAASGVPEDAPLSVRLLVDAGTTKGMYVFSAEGKPELTRRVDAILCAVEGPANVSFPQGGVLVKP